MPLLNKKPFKRHDPPINLQPVDKVFYSEITNEVFTNYDDYWARLVLCNAMVWTCELTGRPNLTYTEAVECEAKARKCVSNIPHAIRLPLLYASTLTRRGRYADMSDDVFNYIRDRYYVGEEVEAIVGKHWYDCKVLRIIHPTREEVEEYEKKMAESDEEEEESSDDGIEVVAVKASPSKPEPEKIDDDIEIIEIIPKKTESPKVGESPKTNAIKKKEEEDDYPPFATFKYEVIEIEAWDSKECKKHTVTWEQIRRNKSLITREKCKLFLKQVVVLSNQGYWCIKENVAKKYNLNTMSYNDIFPGKPPKFQETKAKKTPSNDLIKAQKLKEREEKQRQKKEQQQLKEKQKLELKKQYEKKMEMKKKEFEVGKEMSKEERERMRKVLEEQREQQKKLEEKRREEIREELKIKYEKMKEEKKKEKLTEKKVKMEQRRLQMEYMKEWSRIREDLEIDDLKDIPKPTTVQCRIPDELFSEFIMVLEFVNVFAELLELKDVYPQGITFDMLEHGLVEKEVAGVLNDVFQLLLQAVFTLQEEEDDEVEADNAAEEAIETLKEDNSIQDAVRVANRAATWAQQYYGATLQKVPLDALTLTEVLRLHLLASGATNVANAVWRYSNRGGYKNTDDPGFLLKMEEPEIVKSLGTKTIFDVPMAHKVKILNVLIGQILTYASARDTVEENIEKLKEMKNKIRIHQFQQIKREKEFAAARINEIKEIRQKELEKRMKEAVKKAQAMAAGAADKPIEIDMEAEVEDQIVDISAIEEKEEKKKEDRRQDFMKREQELLKEMLSIARGINIAPLGQDRAYRRYWIFNSLSGLFVEDYEENPGICCRKRTPYNPNSNSDISDELLEMFKTQAEENVKAMEEEEEAKRKEEKNTSDKENESGNSPGISIKNGPSKAPLQAPNYINGQVKGGDSAKNVMINGVMFTAVTENGSVDDEDSGMEDDDDESEISDEEDEIERPEYFEMCTANKDTCKIHSNRTNQHRWYFYQNVEDLNTLIDALNVRGLREKDLKQNIESIRRNIESSIKTCPVYKLDPSLEPELERMNRKSQRNNNAKKDADANLNYPLGTPIDEILQLTLRDMILETEEKIYLGMLGSLYTSDREKWRDSITDGGYFKEGELDYGGRKRITQFKTELGLEVTEEADSVELADENASGGGIVKDLAMAILQLGQSVDTKYLTQPLGETDKLRTKREKLEAKLRKRKQEEDEKEKENDSDEDGSNRESDEEEATGKSSNSKAIKFTDNALRTPMERWEKSLMASTNLSQLCLHYATLDNSITWSRSALNTRCSICRRKSDAENMLLCDGCDKGYHMRCLKPKLKNVPEGDWYCDKCKPKEKPKSPRKKNRQIYKEQSEDELEEESEEELEKENEDSCTVCKRKDGTLVCCDTCPLVYHKECAGLKKVPRGIWSCPQCENLSDEGEAPPEKKKKTSKKKNKKDSKKDTSNKENKEKKEIKEKKDNKEKKEIKEKKDNKEKKKPKKEAPSKKETPPKKNSKTAEKRRRSDGDSSAPVSKKQKIQVDDDENAPKRSSRRSLVDETRELNTPALETVLEEMLKHPLSWPFSRPVSKKEAPDYYEIVKKPMDFRTIHGKLYDMKYQKDEEFIADIMLVFQNCQQYNIEDAEEFKAGETLSKYFTKRIKQLGLNYKEKPSSKKRK